MVKKGNKPYEKVLLGLLAACLIAGLTAPFATGYVNDNSSVFDKDVQASILLENAIARLIDKGEIKLSSKLTSDFVEAKIIGFMGSMPEVSQKDSFFCMNLGNGTVNVRKMREANEIVINNISGD